MNLAQLSEFLDQWVPIERGGPHGERQQRERLAAVAELVLQQPNEGGDIVEIGCLHGSTTVLLAEVARKYGQRVIAIDPWLVGTQNCSGGEYEIFQQTIAPFANTIDVLRMRSDDRRVHDVLWERPLSFAFVDGLHTYEAALHDIRWVDHAAVIAVDDLLWSSEVRKAFVQAAVDSAGKRNLQSIYFPEFREGYLL